MIYDSEGLISGGLKGNAMAWSDGLRFKEFLPVSLDGFPCALFVLYLGASQLLASKYRFFSCIPLVISSRVVILKVEADCRTVAVQAAS